MKRLWPGWLLCGLTAALFIYMAAFEAREIQTMLGGMLLPDSVPLGYDVEGARDLFAAFKAELADAEKANRQSASAAYVSMHAGSDLLFPPMLAASLAFLAAAALNARRHLGGSPRLARIGLGLVFALAFAYLGCDYVENAVADALLGPLALEHGFNAEFVPVLRGLTAGKYLTVLAAFLIIAALWIWRWRDRRGRTIETAGQASPNQLSTDQSGED
ncbi:hypothetical protein [uncultured Hoeflea sp.]|uniref:hypothetical protein n=1 Tax=uncultured Hoeflea sp. TaxID=538666 RepID=UPI002620E661|nr:hypothetical protein [uncultured Hoeflea sp.]